MKKPLFLLLTLVLAGFTSVVRAEWELLEDGAAVRHYFDPQTLEKAGDFPSIVVLHDFSEPTRRGERSARYRAEFDCQAKQWRLFNFATFDGAMASGDVVMQTDTDSAGRSAWRDLPANPVFMRIFAFACGE